MNKENTKKWIATLLITILTFIGLGQTMVHAVDGNGEDPVPSEYLTDVIITKVKTEDAAKDMTIEQLAGGVNVADYFTNGELLPGVSFTYFSVSDIQLAAMKASPANFDTAAKVVTAYPGVGPGIATAETDSNGQVTISGLPEGHYWVVENAKGTITSARAVPFGLILPFTNLTGDGFLRTIYVYPKNTLTDDEPDIKKEVNEPNVAIGQINIWKITLDIPEGIEDYDKFEFYDQLDSRLDYVADSLVINAEGISLVAGTDYNLTLANGRLDVKFTSAGLGKLAGIQSNPQVITFTLQTKVNNTAIMGQEIPNSATLTFNNGHGSDKTKVPGVIPKVHTGGKAFVKKANGENGANLAGAEFKIKNAQGQFVNVAADGTVTFGGNGTLFTSGPDGKFEVKGLPYGEYVLVETKAPQGYALPTDPNTDFTVNATSYYAIPTEVTIGNAPADVIKTILNRRLVIPQTGGMGTALFTVVGATLMFFSVVFYRRTNKVKI